MTLQEERAQSTEPGIYVRPERYESGFQKVRRNLIPIAKGFFRFKLSPKLNGNTGSIPRVKGSLHLRARGKLHIGNKVSFWGTQVPINVHVLPSAQLTIGDRSYFNYGSDIGCYHSISIGNDVLIGPMTNILDDPMHEVEPGRGTAPAPVVIEDNVWLSRAVTVQPGVTIGRNSVVAAGSVVTRDIPPNSLAAGVPAKVIRELSVPEGWRRR